MPAAISVPLLDLRAQYAAIKSEVEAAVLCVMESQHFINGPEVARLEEEFARYCQARSCVAVSSGSDALLVALMALGIGPGDEVITTPYTFFATVGAIVRLGARPVFVDIDPATFNIDPTGISEKITPRTRAIIPVHLFGQCADMDPILEIARANKLAVVEDAAQAVGAEYKSRRAGTLGDLACFSFFPSKNLGAFGDGGAVTTNHAALAEKLTLLRSHGARPKYHHQVVGGNFRLDTLQAAVLLVKLRHLDRWSAQRQEHAAFYDQAWAQVSDLAGRLEPPRVLSSRHVFNQYVIRVAGRDALREHLQRMRVGSDVYYPRPMHLQECFAHLGHRDGDFPESERAARESLALPVYPELTPAQQHWVVQTVADFFVQNRSAGNCAA